MLEVVEAILDLLKPLRHDRDYQLPCTYSIRSYLSAGLDS